MKRAKASSKSDTPDAKKRKVTYSTYEKWRRDFDRECKTVTWLGCESGISEGKRVVILQG